MQELTTLIILTLQELTPLIILTHLNDAGVECLGCGTSQAENSWPDGDANTGKFASCCEVSIVTQEGWS